MRLPYRPTDDQDVDNRKDPTLGRFFYNARTPAAIAKKKRKEPPASSEEPALGALVELEPVELPLGLPPDVGRAELPPDPEPEPDPDPDPDPLVPVGLGAAEVESQILLMQPFRHWVYRSVPA